MAQFGLHGIVGLCMARAARGAKGKEHGMASPSGACRFGLVVGNMLPDADLALTAAAYLFNPAAALGFHRTWSHSLLTQAAACLLLKLGWARKSAVRRGFVSGLWLGMAVHSFVDIFLWFSPVDLLWPLDHVFPAVNINLWADVSVPVYVSNLLGVGEFLFLALFFLYLSSLARQNGTDLDAAAWLRRAVPPFLLLAAVLGGVALFASATLYTVLNFAIFLFVAVPFACVAVWRMRETIARL